MTADPYEILGVKKDASREAIQKAYRRLAKKLHPDFNPTDKRAEEKFKEVSAAYALLSDPDKRGRFDRGEIDSSGSEQPRGRFYRDSSAASGTSANTNESEFSDFGDLGDMFDELFLRRGPARGRATFRMRGEDVHYSMKVDFLDAVNGAKQQVTLPGGVTIDVTIPPGTRDGQILRLRGKGEPGVGGGPAGDALIDIELRPHPLFTRRGHDLHIELPVSLKKAVLGGEIEVPTPTGAVTMTVPKWSNTGTVLRLKKKGVSRPNGTRGDQKPEKPDRKLEKFVARWNSAASRAA